MKPPSKPKINKKNPKLWYIEFSVDVPVDLHPYYKRKRIRFKKYDGINSFSEKEREKYAEYRRKVWEYLLFKLKYNPFDEERETLLNKNQQKAELKVNIAVQKVKNSESLKHNFSIRKAFDDFIQSRKARKISPKSVVTYSSQCDWMIEGLEANNLDKLKIGELKWVHISKALDHISVKRNWTPTTINKAINFHITIFEWLVTEEYINKNPIRGKFVKLRAVKRINKWYDRELAAKVKQAVKNAGEDDLYNAMRFTYHLLIRSKEELRKLKIGDIDQDLKRIRFSAELSKNSTEQFRDYSDEFQVVIDEMKLKDLPQEWYVFGNNGKPGPIQFSNNYLSKKFKSIKDKLGLSEEYTIYGWKHTRIIHELMKGTDGIDIRDMARHSDFKTTKDYLRDYDLTLRNVYMPEDLQF